MPRMFGLSYDIGLPDDQFTQDLRKSALSANPSISAEINGVWVLSGRSTAMGNDADGLQREFDIEDDRKRLRKGISIATRVNLLRARKSQVSELTADEWIVPIFYNGRKIHNQDLKKALQLGYINYPSHLFIIEPIEIDNTLGQIKSFIHYFNNYSDALNTIAVVSSAYHLARVSRTIGKDSPQIEGHRVSDITFLLFGIDKHHARPGIIEDLHGESRAMKYYAGGDKPSISRQSSNNTFLNDADLYRTKSFNRALFWNRVADIPVEKIYEFFLKNDSRSGQLRLLTRPEHIQHQIASNVLVDSFIAEYQQYLQPQDISETLNTWRESESSVEEYYKKYYHEELEHFLAEKIDYWVEARVQGRLVGWATFVKEKTNNNELYMNLLIVAPDSQGKSIGTQLVNSLMLLGVIPHVDAIHLLLRKKNEGGRVFYSKLGFKPNPEYQRLGNFVDMNLLEAFTWVNPALAHIDAEVVETSTNKPM